MKRTASTRTLTLCMAAMLVATCVHAQTSRRNPVHRVGIAMPSPVEFSHTDHFAREIYYMGEGVYHTTLKNTTGRADTFRIEVANDILPDGVGSYDWVTFYCDSGGICHFGPWDYVLEPGEAEVFDVHLIDNVGTTQGMALTTLTATWGRESVSVSFATFVDLPSILLVDDDAGASYETYLEESVEAAGYEARTWDADGLGRPKLDQLSFVSDGPLDDRERFRVLHRRCGRAEDDGLSGRRREPAAGEHGVPVEPERDEHVHRGLPARLGLG